MEPELFSNLQIPEGLALDTLTNTILEECAELEILYTDPDYLKWSLGVWSSKNMENWTKIANALELEYKVLYPQYKKSTHKGSDTRSGSYTDSREGDITHVKDTKEQWGDTDISTQSGSELVTTERYAFNSSAYNPYERVTRSPNQYSNITSYGRSVTMGGADTDEYDRTDTRTYNNLHNEDEYENETIGNIGNTPFSTLIDNEIQMRLQYNIYDIITRQFKEKYCILVY